MPIRELLSAPVFRTSPPLPGGVRFFHKNIDPRREGNLHPYGMYYSVCVSDRCWCEVKFFVLGGGCTTPICTDLPSAK